MFCLGGFVCGPVIILSLNVFRPHYADDDDDDDDDWAHMCVKSVSLAFPLLRRVQLPFPFGAPEAGRRLWQALSLIAAPEIHSTPNTIVSRPPHLYFQLLAMQPLFFGFPYRRQQ